MFNYVSDYNQTPKILPDGEGTCSHVAFLQCPFCKALALLNAHGSRSAGANEGAGHQSRQAEAGTFSLCSSTPACVLPKNRAPSAPGGVAGSERG